MNKKVAVIICVALMLFLAIKLVLLENIFTVTAPRFRRDAYAVLETGDSFQKLDRLLGKPVEFHSISASPPTNTPNPNTPTMEQACAQEAFVTLLRYSRARLPGLWDNYVSYEVFVRTNVVIQKRRYWYRD